MTEQTRPQQVSRKRFEAQNLSHLDKFERNDNNYRGYLTWLVGSEEGARQFLNPKGVAIGVFSKMVGLPVSTVRHYVRLGLVEPWEVEGKYRFDPVNLHQVESVRLWAELGLSLEQIVERQRQLRKEQPGTMVRDILPLHGDKKPLGKALVEVERIFKPTGYTENGHISTLDMENVPKDIQRNERILRELSSEFRAAREKLEAKRLELEQRIARAKELEESLAKVS